MVSCWGEDLQIFFLKQTAIRFMHYQVDNGVVTKYYFARATRIATSALAPGASTRENGTVYYLFSDHLGSTSLLTDGGNSAPFARFAGTSPKSDDLYLCKLGFHLNLVGLDGKYKGRFLSLENLAKFNSIGALKLNDPKEVGNIPLDNKFYDECNSSRCDVNVNDTYTFAEVEYDFHPTWWLLTVGSLTMGPEAPPAISGVLWIADQANVLEQIVSPAGVETDMVKTIQDYYSHWIGSPGRSLPIITIEPAWSHFNYRK